MSMFYTENQHNLELVLKKFNEAVERRFSLDGGASYYEVGYLHNTLIHYIKFLPKTKQKELIRDFVQATRNQGQAQ